MYSHDGSRLCICRSLSCGVLLSGNWYKEQAGFIKKLKKIWAIIRNKDFYYSEIILNKKDWEEYKKWINEK